MFELFKLVGRVLVDTSGADKSLEGTDKKAQGVIGSMGGYIEKLKGFAAAAGAALAGSAIVKGIKEIWDISSQVAEIGDNVDKASQKFMLSRTAYQEWAFVAQRSGFDINQLGNAVVDLSKKVGQGSDDVMAALEEIGISAAEAMTATPEELFDMVITGLQGMGETTRRAYIADLLLAGAAKDLGPLLNTTAEETENLKDQAHALGGVMSDELVAKSVAYEDAVTNLSTAWQGLKNELGDEFLPSMTTILAGLKDVLTGDIAGGLKVTAEGVDDFLQSILFGFGRFIVSMAKAAAEGIANLAKGAYDFGKEFFNPTTDVSEEMATFLGDGQPYDAGADDLIPQLIDLRKQYLAAGGSEFAYIAEVTEKYGAEVADQLIAALEDGSGEIDQATDGYTDAVNDAAKTWGTATADFETASNNAVAAMNAAADSFNSAAAAGQSAGNSKRPGFAVGLPFVPKNDFPARLHYGERVLTRQENEEYSRGGGNGGNTTINIQTVAQSPAQTAALISAALARARWAM